MRLEPFRLGVVGCGGFGLFALRHFAEVPEVRIAAVADADEAARRRAAGEFDAEAYGDAESMVGEAEVDLVYVATPPFLHHEHSMAALEAGRHVLCEKPLALTLEHADAMLRKAADGGLLMVTNMMQRYNPPFVAIGRIVEERLLGEPLHAYFENYAKDEPLPPDHWFWDRRKSGGIFVEHGVHFFDMFRGWFGQGRVLAAQRGMRPGTEIEEQVQCTVRYGAGVLANFYHGFHQPARLDRQELRIVFERGDVTLRGWIPTSVRVRAVADEPTIQRLRRVLPDAGLRTLEEYEGDERLCAGRHKRMEVSRMVGLRAGSEDEKMSRYGELLRAFLRDQVAWVRDRSHRRTVTEGNGRRALALALEADRLAHEDRPPD